MTDTTNSNSLNNPSPGSISRQPRAIVTVNGLQAQGVIEWDVDNNIHYLADAFRIELSLSKQPPHMNWQWWMLQSTLTIEVFVGFPKDPSNYNQGELMSLIVGNVDEIDFAPIADRIVLNGRDLTAKFAETQTTETWKNKFASAGDVILASKDGMQVESDPFAATGDIANPGIVEILAARHGMQVESYHTAAYVGKYYNIDHIRIGGQHSEWDLLTFLANEEGAEVFVRGNTLVFRQPPQTLGNPYVIQWTPPDQVSASPQSNATRIHLSSNRTLARDVIVHVRSWNQKQKAAFTRTAKASHKRISSISPRAIPIGTAQTYFRVIPNLTPQQALQRAQAILAEITSMERRIQAELPGDNILSIDNPVQLTGTGTNFDNFYHAQSVLRRFSFDEGYSMTLEAKNHPPESEVML